MILKPGSKDIGFQKCMNNNHIVANLEIFLPWECLYFACILDSCHLNLLLKMINFTTIFGKKIFKNFGTKLKNIIKMLKFRWK